MREITADVMNPVSGQPQRPKMLTAVHLFYQTKAKSLVIMLITVSDAHKQTILKNSFEKSLRVIHFNFSRHVFCHFI